MKVRCVIHGEFTDEHRRAVRAYYGRTGMATRDELKEMICALGDLGNPTWGDIFEEYQIHLESEETEDDGERHIWVIGAPNEDNDV